MELRQRLSTIIGAVKALPLMPAARIRKVFTDERTRENQARLAAASSGCNPNAIDAAIDSTKLSLTGSPAARAENSAAAFRAAYASAFHGLTPSKLSKGAALVAVTYFIQRFMSRLVTEVLAVSGLRGSALSRGTFLFMAFVVAPLTEEYGRRLSRQAGADGGYTAALNAVEFVFATKTMISKGATILQAVVARLVTALMLHAVAEAVQRYYERMAPLDDNGRSSLVGYWAATGFHMVWNLMAAIMCDMDALTESASEEEALSEMGLL